MFTQTQIDAIKLAITANPAMAAASPSDDGSDYIASLFNAQAAPTFYVWRSFTATTDIMDAITGANMTMNEVPDTSQLYANTQLYNQAKQISLQTLLQGRDFIATGKAGTRAWLQDALTNLRTGVANAVQAAGWTAVKIVISRPATLLEQLLITSGAGTAGAPANLGFEGKVTYSEISAIRSAV